MCRLCLKKVVYLVATCLLRKLFSTRLWYTHDVSRKCTHKNILRVSDQNGASLLYIMLVIHHSGWDPWYMDKTPRHICWTTIWNHFRKSFKHVHTQTHIMWMHVDWNENYEGHKKKKFFNCNRIAQLIWNGVKFLKSTLTLSAFSFSRLRLSTSARRSNSLRRKSSIFFRRISSCFSRFSCACRCCSCSSTSFFLRSSSSLSLAWRTRSSRSRSFLIRSGSESIQLWVKH